MRQGVKKAIVTLTSGGHGFARRGDDVGCPAEVAQAQPEYRLPRLWPGALCRVGE
jgi:hypothetical protein